MQDIEKIKNDLERNLSEKRYNHSLLTAESAKNLAKIYHVDEDKAYLAGLIHDIAKELSEEKIIFYVSKYNISSYFLKPENTKLLHAEIGYYLAHDLYELDEQICNAVRFHTTGSIDMDLFAKIIFIADKIGRKETNPTIEVISDLAKEDIDAAILYYLRNLKERLENVGKKFDGKSKNLFDYLEKKYYN